MAKLVIGLGNPGVRYADTRHNIGANSVAALGARHGLRLAAGRGRSDVVRTTLAGGTTILARPRVAMNVSGESVASLVAFYHVAPVDLLIVCDDLDRPFGSLRLRADGSAGGHNGLRSIMTHLHRQSIPRLKIGIGRPPTGVPPERFVLQSFAPAERGMLPTILGTAADAIECWLHDGLDAAMNRFNGWSPP